MDQGDTFTPEAATAQRAELMASADFRQRAAEGGAEWQQIAALDRAIADGMEGDEADEQPAAPVEQAPQEDGEDFAAFYTVPDSPAGYELPTQLARERGLEVDPMAEIELRKSLHAAGVDGPLATTLYWSALNAQTKGDLSPAGQETAFRVTSHELHRAWGKGYEANLALANAEARRLFDALPRSVTGGADFATFARASGMANSRLVVEELYRRATARQAVAPLSQHHRNREQVRHVELLDDWVTLTRKGIDAAAAGRVLRHSVEACQGELGDVDLQRARWAGERGRCGAANDVHEDNPSIPRAVRLVEMNGGCAAI